MSSSQAARSTFTRVTEGVYWLLVIEALILLACSPTLLVWTLLDPGPGSVLLRVLALIPVVPALAAAASAWQARSEDPDPVPARRFLRGYRLSLADSLALGLPATVVLAVLATDLTFARELGTRSLSPLLLVLMALVLLVLARAVTILSRFRFRRRDLLRLSVLSLVALPLRTLGLVSLGILALGLVLLAGGAGLLPAVSLLSFATWHAERPVGDWVQERFVSPSPDRAAPAAP